MLKNYTSWVHHGEVDEGVDIHSNIDVGGEDMDLEMDDEFDNTIGMLHDMCNGTHVKLWGKILMKILIVIQILLLSYLWILTNKYILEVKCRSCLLSLSCYTSNYSINGATSHLTCCLNFLMKLCHLMHMSRRRIIILRRSFGNWEWNMRRYMFAKMIACFFGRIWKTQNIVPFVGCLGPNLISRK